MQRSSTTTNVIFHTPTPSSHNLNHTSSSQQTKRFHPNQEYLHHLIQHITKRAIPHQTNNPPISPPFPKTPKTHNPPKKENATTSLPHLPHPRPSIRALHRYLSGFHEDIKGREGTGGSESWFGGSYESVCEKGSGEFGG